MSDENPSAPAQVPAPTPAPTPEPAPQPPRRRSGAVWWGITLVFVGGLLLVSQFMPGPDLWRYWPLIIIALGVRGMFGQPGRPWTIRVLGEGLTGVAFGLVLLGQMLGYLSWNVWLNVLALWPLLLVSLGFEIIGKSIKSDMVRALGSIVVIGGLAYASLVMSPDGGWRPIGVAEGESTEFRVSQAHDADVDEGSARIDGGVGEFTVAAGDDLAALEGWSPFEPVFETVVRGSKADVRAGLGEHSWGPWDGRVELHATLDRDVEWDLDVNAGVSEFDIDVTGLSVSAVSLDAGVSSGTLTLGEPEGGSSEAVPVEIKSGVSSLTVRIPEGGNARVVLRGGLVGTDVMGDWSSSREDDERVYESDGFDRNDPFWDIRIEAGIGSIAVEYY